MTLKALYDLPAPAKLNLFLHIVGRRADGYHLLQSPFVMLDWADTLHFERRDDGRLLRHDLGPALPADDLCLRAARLLQASSAAPLGADISILKQVPWGAGMGGGSSDAATTLLALNRLWALNWPRQRLAALGLQLGADVPFFIGGHNAFVEGIGEKLSPLHAPPRSYAVVKPPQAIATREIFAHPALRRDTEPVIVVGSPEEAGHSGLPTGRVQRQLKRLSSGLGAGSGAGGQDPEWETFSQTSGRNDLQPPAEDRCPEVAQAARWLATRYGNSRMTGSGSAVFSRVGVSGPPMATDLAAALSGMPQDWVGRMCRSLVRHPLADWAD